MLIKICHRWDSTERMTPDEARRHEWLAGPAATYPDLPNEKSHSDQQTSFFSTVLGFSCFKV